MFGKQHRFPRVAASLIAAAALLPVAHAGAQETPGGWGEHGMPRAMPSDYAAHFGYVPRAVPSDYGTQIRPGDYGMPRAMPADYAPVGGSSGGNGFDWADAGIGAGAAFGLVLLALTAAHSLRRTGRLEQA